MYKLNICFTLPRKKYISMNLSKHPGYLLALFKCGVLPTKVETGRYQDKASQ